MKGTTRECLRDFLTSEAICFKLADVLHVQVQTVRTWRKDRMPTGVTLIQLRNILELFGYKVVELDELDPTLRKLGECLTFGTLRESDVRREIGLKDVNSFVRYFRTSQKSFAHHMDKLREIAWKHASELEPRKNAIKEFFASCTVVPATPTAYARSSGGREVGALPSGISAISSTPAPTPNNGQLPQAPEAAVIRNNRGTPSRPLAKLGLEERMSEFAQVCARTREIGGTFLNGTVEERKALRRYMMRNQKPEIHDTFDVLHKLMKERKADASEHQEINSGNNEERNNEK